MLVNLLSHQPNDKAIWAFQCPFRKIVVLLETDEIALGLDALCVQQTKAGLLGKKMNGSAKESCFSIYCILKNKFQQYILYLRLKVLNSD